MISVSFVHSGKEHTIKVEIDEDMRDMALDEFRDYLNNEMKGVLPQSFNFLSSNGVKISIKQEEDFDLDGIINPSTNQIELQIQEVARVKVDDISERDRMRGAAPPAVLRHRSDLL